MEITFAAPTAASLELLLKFWKYDAGFFQVSLFEWKLLVSLILFYLLWAEKWTWLSRAISGHVMSRLWQQMLKQQKYKEPGCLPNLMEHRSLSPWQSYLIGSPCRSCWTQKRNKFLSYLHHWHLVTFEVIK